MSSYVLSFRHINKTMLPVVGGKGASLGELARIDGIHVPDGFCITTEAYKTIIAGTPLISELLDKLSLLRVEQRDAINELSSAIRKAIKLTAIPPAIKEEVAQLLASFGDHTAYAIRSSATAEDLPTASFAGQQDTYLNVIGKEEVLKHISKCWASLFTNRAVIYRIQNGFDHRKVYLSVVVQKMVFPQVAGIMFTADPVNGNRKVVSIDASFGLGEALVAGFVNADVYKVRGGEVIDKKIATKKLAVYALQNGGTNEQEINPAQQNTQALTDAQILELEGIGRKIEAHFGRPQDIEWCLADDTFYIVQSRPITTLFPIPEANDQENHVYVSGGHPQMMTDAIKPLGLSVHMLVIPAHMRKAGGRLFADVTAGLASPASRKNLLEVLGHGDPLIKDALMNVLERGDFIKLLPGEADDFNKIKSNKGMAAAEIRAQAGDDPSICSRLVEKGQASVAALQQNIQTKHGDALFAFILEDIQQVKKDFAENLRVVLAGMNAAAWLNEKIKEWLGEKNVVDILSQSVSNNITSEMGLELLDVADVVRSYPEVIEYLQQVKDDNFLDALLKLNGGQQTRHAIMAFLNKYGMRCVGEIDITRTRWSEKPLLLVPLILSNLRTQEPGASKRKFEQGLQQAVKKEQELLAQLAILPDGAQKAAEAKQMIDVVRNFAGYREYPKYNLVSRYFIYKQALLKEAVRLLQANVLHEKEDIFYLTFEELREAVNTNSVDQEIIRKRKEEYRVFEKLVPPRVITSDGECLSGKYDREDLPAGAIAGLPVSSGIIEGRARVILKMEDAGLEEGDILVTTFTDPSWTPLFVSIKGLVTEVGGLMTHGAVIAREYGLPAVVGVDNATRLIKDGQRIRVNGTDGYVEVLP
jgi:phosphoenolpyruvate synthase/pyruvate phosphate dikinase